MDCGMLCVGSRKVQLGFKIKKQAFCDAPPWEAFAKGLLFVKIVLECAE